MSGQDSRAGVPAWVPGRLYSFHGGLTLPARCEATAGRPIMDAGVPPELVLPLMQHIGEPARPLVKPGEHISRNQVIATPTGKVSAAMHAPASGTVTAIESRPIPHPSGLESGCIVIETDSEATTSLPAGPASDYLDRDPALLREQVLQAGIVGLGGAGFPTHAKLDSARSSVELLVINGVECEPCIACDNRLMQEYATEIIEGTKILQRITRPAQCLVAVEAGMDAAEQAMREALRQQDNTGIELVRVPDIYPSGGERQLIRILTGREVPSQGIPADIGIICQNVGTAKAVYDAVAHDQPLVSRIVTVTGGGIAEPRNVSALIGTPVSQLVEACGGYTRDVDRLVVGGPMMGYTIHSDAIPITKTTNCIMAVTREEMPPPPPAQPCIRCGKCTDVCPAELLPQQLYWYARSGNHDAVQDYDLFDCIECGLCAHVCPSHIPLVQYYRHAKMTIWAQESQRKRADIARQRHEARQARLERIKQERAERMARKKRELEGEDKSRTAKQAAIQAALERVKRKKQETGVKPANIDNLTSEQQKLIDEVNARRSADTRGEKD